MNVYVDDDGDKEDGEDEHQEEFQKEQIWDMEELEAFRLQLLCNTNCIMGILKLKRVSVSLDSRYKRVSVGSDDDV